MNIAGIVARTNAQFTTSKLTAALQRSVGRSPVLGLFCRSYAAKSYPPHTRIDMPALSPTMTAGNIGNWHKQIGDEIVAGDLLVEIETDKAQMDFECQEEGFLAKILMPGGSKDVDVNFPIAVLAESKDDIAAFEDYVADSGDSSGSAPSETSATESSTPSQASAPARIAAATTATSSGSDRVIASPLAKKTAVEKGVDLSNVQGTGPNSRIVKSDVDGAKSAVASAPVKAAPAPVTAPAGVAYTDVPLTNMRKVIASRLLESKTTIPHYYLTSEITVEKVLKLREVLNSQANGQFKLSVNDFVIKAAALALRQMPEVNSGWGGDVIRQFHNVDISVAVSTDSGLITPIVTNADTRGLTSISASVKDLATRARENKLAPHEYQGGSFTISNLGMFGSISEFSAIINPPQSCILAVGQTEKVVVPNEDMDAENAAPFTVVRKMKVTLSCDHRVVDGAVGAQWLAKFKGYLENPLTFLL